MAITVRQSKSATLSGEGGTTTIALNSAVAAGSTLVVVGAVAEYPVSQSVLLSSVNDTSTNTWGTPSNVRTTGAYLPNVFGCVAENVAAGSPTVTLNWDSASGVRPSFVLYEISGPVTASGVDKTVTGTSTSALSVSTSATGTLTQANNLAILVAGGWFEWPTNPSGWTSALTVKNGTYIGCQVSHKNVSTTTSITGTVDYEVSASAAALMYVIKEAATATLQYKFQLKASTFTSADTGITGYVWRNSGPDGVFAEKYEGLGGDATAGNLIITGIPAGASVSDTITGVFYNSTDTSGLISGTVEEA